jgi:hypothetical protein
LMLRSESSMAKDLCNGSTHDRRIQMVSQNNGLFEDA